MKICVVGGSGFIGTRLVSLLLESEHEVRILDIVPSETHPLLCVHTDVRDTSTLSAIFQGVDIVVNLAAVHRDDVRPAELYYEVNVNGAMSCCEAAVSAGVRRIVFTSSVAVYGTCPSGSDEETPLRPESHYGKSKAEAEMVYKAWAEAGENRHLLIVRPTVVFGEGNRGNVYNLIRQVADRRFVMIGDGRNYKSMAYVGNVAAFLVHMMSRLEGTAIINYVDRPDFDMNTLVGAIRLHIGRSGNAVLRIPLSIGLTGGLVFDLLAGIAGRPLPISRVRVRKFTQETRFSSRYIDSTGFQAPVPIGSGLRNTLNRDFPVQS